MTSKRFFAALLTCGSLASLVACSEEFAPSDVSPDAMADAAPDMAPDAAPDSGVAPPDADEVDAAPDSHTLAEASTADATADVARDTTPDRPDAPLAPDAPTDVARDTQSMDSAVLDTLADAAVDAPPVGSDAAIDGSRTCIFQGPNGPLECHAASPGGRTYCSAAGACTTCEAPQWLNCDGNDVNGCEVFMSDDNCGSCGVKCNSIQFCNLDVGGGTCQKKPDAG